MKKNIEFMPIIFLSLVALHILAVVILRFLFKIKSNIPLESSIRKNKSKIESKVYVGLFILAFILSILFDKQFSLIIIPICLENLILSIKVLNLIENAKDRYHYITSLIFHPLQIISLILSAFTFT